MGTEVAGGYMGRLLWVDLSEGHIQELPLQPETCRDFVGGYGLGARVIYSRQKPGGEALGHESILGLLTGPCTGTSAIGGSRFMLVGKSPLTGTWGDSDSGGYFGPELKFAGFDGVFFTGKSESPVYLVVENGRAELRDAAFLWGRDTLETERMLKAELGDKTQVACIGPAGERLSLISCVIHDGGRAAARSGFGAVMGSKRLKAVAVRGDIEVPIANAGRLRELRKSYLAQLKGSDVAKLRNRYGTCAFLRGLVRVGDTPVKNWSGVGPLDFAAPERISDEAVIKYEVKKYACYRCPIACGGHMQVADGPYSASGHKPEYETLAAFGALTLNDSVESIIKLNEMCNRAGLDTISAGSTIAFAIECYEQGIIGNRDAGGVELRWGNADAIIAVLEKIVRREGLGDILADGVKKAAERLGAGAQSLAVHCAGQEPGMHDPKFLPGLALSYQMDATPGRHGQGGHWMEGFPEYWKKSLGVEDLPTGSNKYDYGGKGEVFKRAACMLHFIHCSGLCRFPWYHIDPASMWEFVSAVTGWDIDREEAYRIGERVANIRQAFNVREGFNALEHPIHPRMVGVPPLEKGATKGVTVDMDTLLDDFLRAMDWDTASARPSARKLTDLGLGDVAEDLW